MMMMMMAAIQTPKWTIEPRTKICLLSRLDILPFFVFLLFILFLRFSLSFPPFPLLITATLSFENCHTTHILQHVN